MRRSIRWSLLAIAGVALAMLSSLGTFVYIETTGWSMPTPPIVQGLSAVGRPLDRARFNARLRRQFPVGTPESVLTGELKRQGFLQKDWGGRAGTRHEALWHRDGLPCAVDVWIDWTADNKLELTSIIGLYGQACL